MKCIWEFLPQPDVKADLSGLVAYEEIHTGYSDLAWSCFGRELGKWNLVQIKEN